MPKKDTVMDGIIPKTRCYKELETEMLECAKTKKMDPNEYVRAAVRDMNERVKKSV